MTEDGSTGNPGELSDGGGQRSGEASGQPLVEPAAGASPVPETPAGLLDPAERRQLSRLRRWGTAGALLMMFGATSSYGAANPIPNPVDGSRLIGLLSRVGPASLAISYSGIGLVVLCWFLLGRLSLPGRPRRLSRTQLTHTLAMWTVPLLVTPPIFSRDVYSYLAVGAMMLKGDNPYQSGPYDSLGDGNVFAHQVDARWQHTSSPYGPAFLLVTRAVVAVSGNHLVAGVLLQRSVELIGVVLIVWALPRLAARCGVDPVGGLWLGALNPLVLFHLVAGGHNEALMIGTMLTGLEIGLSTSTRHRSTLLHVALGTALICVAAGIKVTAAMALAFLAIALARRWGGRWADLGRATAGIGAVTLVTFGLLTIAGGSGLGWVNALSTPGSVRSFLSLSTSLGVGSGQLGLLLGLGDHSGAAIGVLQPVGQLVGGLVAVLVMWRCWQRKIEPIQGLGVALGAFVLLGPVIQPWYLLWAALPLAASTGLSRSRRATVWLTAVFAVIIMPNGATIPAFTIIQAVVIAFMVTAGAFYLLSRAGLPDRSPPPGGLIHPVVAVPTGAVPAAVAINEPVTPVQADAYPR